jgi:hypothetical protein
MHTSKAFPSRLPFLLFTSFALLTGLSSAATPDPELEKAIAESTASLPKVPATKVTPSGLYPSSTALPLSEVFSVEKNPGRGTIHFSKPGNEPQTFSFGPDTGHYACALVFPHETLPPAVQAEFRDNEVIQILFGTLNRSVGNRVGQFGAASLMVTRGAKASRVIPLRMPAVNDTPLPESGFFLFTSPETQSQSTDEEKLKNTFFGKGGFLKLSASASPRPLTVIAQGKKFSFKIQAMRMEIEAPLSTPFNNEDHTLHGQVEFPLYYPEGAAARKFVAELAENSFNAKASIHIPSELGRQLSSPPSKKPKK